MSEPIKPLKKPPGYRDPSIPIQMPPPSFYPPRRRRRNCCCRCCCYFILFLIFVILLLIVCGAIFFLWFNPKLPVFHLTSLDFTKFAVTNCPDGGSSLNAQGTVGVEMKNPNKQLKMVYGRTKVELRGGTGGSEDMSLGKGIVRGFVQKAGNVRELKVRIWSKELLFGKSAINVGDRFKRKTLKVNAEVKTGIGIGFSGGWSTGLIGVTVRCKGLSLKHISDATSRKCHVKLLNLVDIS
nr:NDR1/HIN1-like protein 6 [Ipomoea batatas]